MQVSKELVLYIEQDNQVTNPTSAHSKTISEFSANNVEVEDVP